MVLSAVRHFQVRLRPSPMGDLQIFEGYAFFGVMERRVVRRISLVIYIVFIPRLFGFITEQSCQFQSSSIAYTSHLQTPP